MKRIYVCHDTLTGIYSALHDAWVESRNGDAGIRFRGRIQQQLFCDYHIVEENEEKVIKIERLIKRHLGYNAYWAVYHALLSDEEQKAEAVFHTMQEARWIADSQKIMDHLGNESVAMVFELSRRVSNESHMYKEFIRFREIQNGVLVSEISPRTQVLTCIADHFADRFPLENWMIIDRTHHVTLLHKAKGPCRLLWDADPDSEALSKLSDEEEKYENLWKGFFDSVSIRERENPKLQQSHLPLRYRDMMPEFTGD